MAGPRGGSRLGVANPDPRSRQVEVSRGLLAAASGDVPRCGATFGQALEMTARQDRRAARCEILAAYALECVRAGPWRDRRIDRTCWTRPRHGPSKRSGSRRTCPADRRGARRRSRPLAAVAFARGDPGRALQLAHAVLAARHEAMREDPHLEMLLPVAAVVLAAGDEAEVAAMRDELQLLQGLIAQRSMDGDVRAKWFQGPIGSELAGPGRSRGCSSRQPTTAPEPSSAAESRMLGLLIEGRTNREIGQELGVKPESVGQALAAMYARIGATSRSEATVLALSGAV